ncbi:MAG: histidine kinase [Microbacterium sp.]|uniref:sensor histidine kinase n=1 Tax=Microbacterium sp. TaxID=51671 RepID=UPI0027291FE3|nr:histidine kinase [Microbacterium sp.]MDO8381687.1 histidine kinase [Microbacterium sp.]
MRRFTEDGELAIPRPPAWVVDIVVFALVVGAAFMPFPLEEYRPDTPVAMIFALLPAVLLLFRRRWPRTVLGACIVSYGIVAVVGTVAPGVVLAIGFALFGLAIRSNFRVTLVAAVLSIGAVIGLSMLAAIGSVFDPRTFQFALTVAFFAAAGDATRFRHEYIVAITERARRAEQTRESEAQRRVTEERLRIARDLHDAVAHQISVISLNAGVASTSLETRPEKTREALASIRTASRAVLGEIGDLLEMLRAEEGERGEASVRPPQPSLDRLDELIGRFHETGLEVGVRSEGDLERVPVPVQRIAYRVVQEGLTNAHKHGAEHRAHVLLDVEPDALVVVVTNPVAPEPKPERDGGETRGGHGLIGLRERVATVRGTVQTGPTPGGFRLAATLPLTKVEETR